MQKIKRINELAYFVGMVLCALGVVLSANSGFGVSMVVAPAYVLHRFFIGQFAWFSFGVAEYCLQGAIVLLTALICRRFRAKYLLCFGGILFYGTLVDVWRALLGSAVWQTMGARVLSGIGGAVIVSFAIALLLRTYLPQQAYELCVQEIVFRYNCKLDRVKWTYDLTSLGMAIVLMFVLFGRFDATMIGPGTLILTVVNAPMIAAFGRLLDRFCEFSPAFDRFQKAYEKTVG